MTPPLLDLAPTGVLRAGMNLANCLFMARGADGELRGIGVDVVRELAAHLGVPLELVVHPTPGDVADAAGLGTWDVAVLAIEPARSNVLFSPPLTAIEATYAVPVASRWQRAGELDAPGVRLSAAEKAGYELFLSRTLQHATLVRARGIEASIDLLEQGEADAVASLRPMLLEALRVRPALRTVEGGFMVVNHGLAVPRGREQAAAYLRGFVADLHARGFVAQAIRRHAVAGVAAAG